MRKRHSPVCLHEHTSQHSPVCLHVHTRQLGSRRGGLTRSLYYSVQILFLKLLDFLILSFVLFLQEFELMNVLVIQKLQISCLVWTLFQCSFQLLKWERWKYNSKDQDIGTKLRCHLSLTGWIKPNVLPTANKSPHNHKTQLYVLVIIIYG